MKTTLRRALRIGGATAVGGTVALNVYSPAVRRETLFWTQAAPIGLHYFLADYYSAGWSEQRRTEHFKWLHGLYAVRVNAIVLQLRGFFIKVAQMASTRDDWIPDEYQQFMKRYQDAVPMVMSIDEVHDQIERELGRPCSEIFSDVDQEPIGCATIGQVYRAKLLDGREVAVKVQYPDCETVFRQDLKLCVDWCRLFMPQHLPHLEEMQRQFESEFEYSAEAEQLDAMATIMQHSPFASQIYVPRPHIDLCSKRVLVMDLVKGHKLLKGLREQLEREAHRRGVHVDDFEREQKGTPPPSNAFMTYVHTVLTVRDFTVNTFVSAWNLSLGLLPGWQLPRVRSERPINIRWVLKLVSDVHAYQVFHEGRFNGDPHPGNIMLMDDGRIGLILRSGWTAFNERSHTSL
jgi:aarF domain-containing kinase